MREFVGCQGEVTIIRIAGEMPTNLKPHTDKTKKGEAIISHSESGHHHVLERPVDVFIAQDAPKGMDILYALLEAPNALVQDAPNAHGKHDLAPGLYEFRIAREWDPFGEQARKVAD